MTALTLYNPLRRHVLSRGLFNDFFRPLNTDFFETEERELTPRVDIAETDNEFTLTADLPGFTENEINLEVEDGQLTLLARHEEEKEEEKENFHLKERKFGAYRRIFYLPDTVDGEKINAKMAKGVLTMVIPKREETKPKKIEIQVH